MKKLFFALLLSLTLCLGTFAQQDDELKPEERTMEVIPVISAVGGQNGISLNSELIIAKKFSLSRNHKWSLFAQAGAMYNLYQNEVLGDKFSESQLGLEPMIGIGTNHLRLSGFLNGLSVKAWDTGNMPFVEGGVRLSFAPWRWMWVSVFGAWPISNPIFVDYADDYYYETDEGVFLVNTEKWARQVRSFGADIDLGIGKKLIFNLDGFATENDNYQVGAGIQYRLFKHKPWILGGNVNYTNFKNEEYYYVHNIFPGMFGENLEGLTFRLGISNYGGLGDVNFSNVLMRIAQPQYYSPVQKEVKKKATRVSEAFKFEPCVWGGDCLDFSGSLCITGGQPVYKIFVNWGDGITEGYTINEMGPYGINHHYSTAGEYLISISGMDGLGKTFSYNGKFVAKNCGDTDDECEKVTMRFDVNQNSVKKLGTLYFGWNVQNAEKVTFNEKEVSPIVGKYAVTFNEIGKFTYTLKAFNGGKLCLQKTITINVVECDIPIISLFVADPMTIIEGKSNTSVISWSTTLAKKVLLDGKEVALSGNQTVTVTGPQDHTLTAINDCSEVSKTLHIDYIPCVPCDSIFFHADGSQTKIFNGNPCLLPNQPPWHLPYTIYNRSQYCEFDVRIHWIITRDNVKFDEGEYTVHVPAGANPLNLFFDYPAAGATIQCCYNKITLKIVGCT